MQKLNNFFQSCWQASNWEHAFNWYIDEELLMISCCKVANNWWQSVSRWPDLGTSWKCQCDATAAVCLPLKPPDCTNQGPSTDHWCWKLHTHWSMPLNTGESTTASPFLLVSADTVRTITNNTALKSVLKTHFLNIAFNSSSALVTM